MSRSRVSCGSWRFVAREGLDSTDARATARALIAMSVTEIQQQFRGSPMKRATRRGLARNAAVMPGNVGTSDDVPFLEAALQHDEPRVREDAAWAPRRIEVPAAIRTLASHPYA